MLKKIINILLLLCCCAWASAQGYRIGDVYTAPDGSKGIVYYLHPDGSGGWVVALKDTSMRTNTMSNSWYEAINAMDTAHGWELPSWTQLNMLFAQLPFVSSAIINAGGEDLSQGYYWSSDEESENRAYMVSFSNGSLISAEHKTYPCHVRAVRSFIYPTITSNTPLTYHWNTDSTQAYIIISPDTTTTYTVTGTDTNGCSDMAQITVVVKQPATGIDSIIACDSLTWIDGVTYYDSTTTPSYTYPGGAANGCDSIVTLHLTVNHKTYGTDTIVACESYTWINGTRYNESNYSDTYTIPNGNEQGCDSVVTLHLTITDVNLSITSSADTICAGESDTLWVLREFPVNPAVGDILCNDNSFVKLDDWPAVAAVGKVAQGIVYYLHPDGSGGWVVALHDAATNCKWGEYGDVPGLINYANDESGILQALTDTAAYTNTLIIRNYQTNYVSPLEYAARKVNFEQGWVLPTLKQLGKLYFTHPSISSAITAVGGDEMYSNSGDRGHYWSCVESSTDRAFGIHFTDGAPFTRDKTDYLAVRAVKSFSNSTSVYDTSLTYQWHSGSIQLSNTQPYIIVSPNTTTTYTVTGTDTNGCSGMAQITIVVKQKTYSDTTVVACNSYTWIDGVTYTESNNTATYTLTNAAGCDSIVTLNLTINKSSVGDTSATACDIFFWHGNTYTESGNYYDTLTNAAGCDSIVTLHLTVNYSSGTCVAATDFDGNIYDVIQIGQQCWMKENLRTTHYADGTSIALGSSTSSTTAYRYYPNNNGDNVSTYGYLYNWKAVMGNSVSSDSVPSGVQGICPRGWHVPSNAEWTQLTNYVSSQNEYVCGNNINNIAKALASTTGWNDSPVDCATGNNPSTNNATDFGAMPAGNYEGTPVPLGTFSGYWSATQSNQSNALGRSINIYYSVVNSLNKSKSNAYSVRCLRDYDIPNDTISVCDNQLPYIWNGDTLNEEGTYSVTLQTIHGCDSMVRVCLVVKPTYNLTEFDTICQSELPYNWRDTTFEAGTISSYYVFHRNTAQGCDSTVTLALTVNPAYDITLRDTVCQSELPYAWRDTTFEAGTVSSYYVFHRNTAQGCDSTVTLALTVNPAYDIVLRDTVCQSELPYAWRDTIFDVGTVNSEYVFHRTTA
ncbi:MAG: hypothetical protein IJR53_01430, partial [Bacteroidales bacterium]|nr:hypothetical protein [Bacteroidales bacterium]